MSTPSCSIKGIFCRFRLWSTSQSYQQLRCSPLLSEKDDLRTPLSWRKRRSLVPVLTGRGRQVFLVAPHILEHWLFQDLLHKQGGTSVREKEEGMEWERDEFFFEYARRNKRRSVENGLSHPVFLDCDAILFEFFLWLIENDDPSLRDLKLDDLMEFYGSES